MSELGPKWPANIKRCCRMILITDSNMLPAQGGPARHVIKPNGRSLGWEGWSGASGLGGVWRGRELGKEVQVGAL